MTKKDDEIAGAYVPPPAHMPQRNVPGNMSGHGTITISGSASLTAAVASVTPAVKPADLDVLMAQLNRLKMPTHKLLAEGALKLKDVEITTPLPDDLVKHTLSVTYQDRERSDKQKHEKSVALIPAILTAVGALILALVSWYLGKLSGAD